MSRKYRKLKRYGFRCLEKLPYVILEFEWLPCAALFKKWKPKKARGVVTNIETPALEVPFGNGEFTIERGYRL